MIHIFTLINIELFCRYLSVSGVRVRGPGRFCRSVKESLNGPVQANRSDGIKTEIGIERKKLNLHFLTHKIRQKPNDRLLPA